MPALPVELVHLVLDNIHRPRHLLPVSLSCRLFRHEAQRLLFRDPGELSMSTWKLTSLIDTIISSPDRLAQYVKIFRISFDLFGEVDDLSPPNSDETVAFVQKLSNALQAMRNLESLDISDWTSSIDLPATILPDIHFTNLTSFSWFGDSDTASDPGAVKADFLRRHDNIEHLVIPDFIDENTLKPIAADIRPRLRSLSAPYSLTKILLPGKKHITSLKWTCPFDISVLMHHGLYADVSSGLELISKELGRIRYLSYDIMSMVPAGPDIQRIAPYLTSLVCLDTRIDNINLVCVADKIISTEKLNEILQQADELSRLPCLKILVLYAGLRGQWLEEYSDALIKIAASCTSLDHIDVEAGDDTLTRLKYDHSSASLQRHAIDRSDMYTWAEDFAAFDD